MAQKELSLSHPPFTYTFRLAIVRTAARGAARLSETRLTAAFCEENAATGLLVLVKREVIGALRDPRCVADTNTSSEQ
jgi:hypothetical protein